MRCWRICKSQFASIAFTGYGASRDGGRWNFPGTAVVYTAQSKSLAAMEQLVGLDRSELPPSFVCFSVDVPEDAVRILGAAELPSDWHETPPPDTLKHIGSTWAHELETVCLSVPSAVIPGERNFILNPSHPGFARLTISDPEPFRYDERILPSRDDEGAAPASARAFETLRGTLSSERPSANPRRSPRRSR